ncbi:NAD(+) diphosphatase [Azospirillum sp.]|uniref:NAD(+) diphosphatase n=1 Tax=Azospirillum sp. TaxID=34012 RepID=UPI002D4BA9D7|nr:NAD(+) diphosphatase [Azospirillum sp.]HYD66961.1 NAD(+) diphosphatase [Azospirillum sp.]
MIERPNVYAAAPLDRAAHRRKDAGWLSAARAAPDALVLPLWQARSLVNGPEEAPRAVMLPAACDWGAEVEPVLLGLMGEVPLFAVDLTALAAEAEAMAAHPLLAGQGRFLDLRSMGLLLPRGEAALCAYARGLLWWNARHRFCGVCGAPALSAEAGHVRVCSNPACGAQHFPRTDPAVIMLVHDGGDHCLLGRQAAWPPGMYSTLAGFVEPGECLEEAVAREVFEEVGLRVTDIRYHSSQPWPFPSSLMLGFTARALDTEIALTDEIQHAVWVTRERMRDCAPDDESFRPPRGDSIARRLIDDWIAAG